MDETKQELFELAYRSLKRQLREELITTRDLLNEADRLHAKNQTGNGQKLFYTNVEIAAWLENRKPRQLTLFEMT